MFKQMEKAKIQDLHFKFDKNSDLRAIIAIHNTLRGPGLGGCRFISYPSTKAAIDDAIRLAEGMSYKAALAGLQQGGAKAVIIKPEGHFNRKKIFTAFGRFVEEMSGRYITAIDSGSTTEDMDCVASETNFLTCTTKTGDPSFYTAQGVFKSIQTCLRLHPSLPDNLTGVTVAIQGVGNVGFILAEQLNKAGAQLIIADPDEKKTALCRDQFNAKIVPHDQIYSVDCDIFSPCGLGSILSQNNISKLKCRIVAGSANNQLASFHDGKSLQKNGILYAPDYLVNAGGLIFVSLARLGHTNDQIGQKINHISQMLENLINWHNETGKPMSELADIAAKNILNNKLNPFLDTSAVVNKTTQYQDAF